MQKNDEIRISISPSDYELFLRCKSLPRYQVVGREIITDQVSYAAIFGGEVHTVEMIDAPHLLDFQEMITRLALRKKRFAAFLDCGLGKTPIALAWAHSVAKIGKVLILCPLSVFEQMRRECQRWHGHRMVSLRHGEKWDDGIAIMNYEGRRKIDMSGVAGVVLDEASILKNDTGETRNYLIELVRNVEYRLTDSATPAPNDHEEYASQAVFLGLVQSAKEFYARFFRKEGPRWILKGHAVNPFYEHLASWAIYLKSPSALGYDCMTEMPCEPNYIYTKCKPPAGFKGKSEGLFASADTAKDRPAILGPLRSDPASDRTTKIVEWAKKHKSIIWVSRNAEETMFHHALPNSVVINGAMPVEKRVENIDKWRGGKIQHLISKPTVLGFGINLPECDRMVFSGYNYSFEQFYQAVRRAHRFGRSGRLKVMVPYTWPELPILDSLKRKMGTFDHDTEAIQSFFQKGVGNETRSNRRTLSSGNGCTST